MEHHWIFYFSFIILVVGWTDFRLLINGYVYWLQDWPFWRTPLLSWLLFWQDLVLQFLMTGNTSFHIFTILLFMGIGLAVYYFPLFENRVSFHKEYGTYCASLPLYCSNSQSFGKKLSSQTLDEPQIFCDPQPFG